MVRIFAIARIYCYSSNMQTYVTRTMNIAKDLDFWLREKSKREGSTQRELVERALRIARDDEKRQKMIRDFKKAAKDPEMLAMAEEDMGDYWESLKTFL